VIVSEIGLHGAFVFEPDRFEDERGFFANIFERGGFESLGLETGVHQYAVSFNRQRGTLRGMHLQVAPYEQAKVVRCTRGSVYDVIVDLRPDEPTFRSWKAVALSAGDLRSLYVPRGLAHGFLTIEDDTEVSYILFGPRHPPSERGVRWNDPGIGIAWPFEPSVMSARDSAFPLLAPEGIR
jgi:dTDP-4-dehydrorhamnose 3,5-epimerase